MMEETDFRPRYNELMQLINQRRFRRVLDPAWQLAEESGRAEAWFLYNLAICLTGKRGGARKLSPKLVEQIRRCDDYDVIAEGDARRDRINALVNLRRRSDILAASAEIIAARSCHRGDDNRMLCLHGSEGRLYYARKKYALANDAHYQADKGWQELGNEANEQWAYNNLVHWLKAVVKQCGRTSGHAEMLRKRIREECPEGAKNRSAEADRICWPVIGNFVDDMARAFGHLLPNWLYRLLHR